MAELTKPNVVNLHVKRQERCRDVEGRRLIWVCTCGCQHFHWYDAYGLRCVECDKYNVPRKGGDWRG